MSDGLFLLIKIRLRNNNVNERKVQLAADLLPALFEELTNNVEIREASVYERLFHHHKSYAEDFTVSTDRVIDLVNNHPDEVRRALGLAAEIGAAVDVSAKARST